VEALVQTLSKVEESPTPGKDVNAALSGFSAEYGVAVPKLDTTVPTDQQAGQLLRAVLPSLSTYDPLTSDRSALVQQSSGLASSVAALFSRRQTNWRTEEEGRQLVWRREARRSL